MSIDQIMLKDKQIRRVQTLQDSIDKNHAEADRLGRILDEEELLDDDVFGQDPLPEHPDIENIAVYTSKLAGYFKRVINDEGHKLKNCRTQISKAISKLLCSELWIVTATPMMNRVSDMLGYLTLFWKPEWLTDLEALDGYELPLSPERQFTTRSIEDWEKKAVNYVKKYDGWPMFLFNPHSFATLVNKGAIARGTTAQVVLTQILGRLQLRWSMASRIHLDGDAWYQPGAAVPIYRIAGVEVWPSTWEKVEYGKVFSNYSKHLAMGGSAAPGAPSTMPIISEAGTRDMAVHRLLCLATFDLKLCTLMIRQVLGGVQQVQEWKDEVDDKGFSTYFDWTKPTPVTPIYTDRIGVCGWLAAESVKLRYACKHILWSLYGDEAGQFKGKTIFYIN